MQARRKLFILAIVVLTAAAFAFSYFVRPHESQFDVVTARQELPDRNKIYPEDFDLPKRISQSYDLALILTESEFSARNAIALDAIRTWARANVQKDPGFLHPLVFETIEPQSSIFGATVFNLFATPCSLLEGQVANFLAHQIENFHSTDAFYSVRSDYFDMYGEDSETATMLAKYESEKAKSSIDIIVCALVWFVAFLFGLWKILKATPGTRALQIQKVFAWGWLLLSICYLIKAWCGNDVPAAISFIVAAVIGLYIWRPIAVNYGEDRGLTLRLLVLSPRWVAFVAWISITFAAIQILTWIRSGSLTSPDPITLLLSSYTGNFIQDPVNSKKNIARLIGISWVIFSLAITTVRRAGTHRTAEIEREFAILDEKLSNRIAH
jgi:hypothetical protein